MNGEIVDVITYGRGSNSIVNEIKSIFGVDNSINILPILDNLSNLDLVNEHVPVINKYSEILFQIREATSYDIKRCLIKVVNKFLNEVSEIINKTKINHDKIFLNVNDDLFFAINSINFDFLKTTYKFELMKTEIIGLEEKNVCNLLASIDYVYNLQKNSDFIYSVDNYVSQEISSSQTKQNFLLKLGLISTK
jgi:hypothetical protein